MGQWITLIVTREVPDHLPDGLLHFIQNGYLVMPVDYLSVDRLLERFLRYRTLYDLFGDPTYQPNEPGLELIRETGLQTFVLRHLTEHGDMAIDEYDFIVRDGVIHPETIRLTDEDDDYYTETLLGYFTDELPFDISRYHNYASCVALFNRP